MKSEDLYKACHAANEGSESMCAARYALEQQAERNGWNADSELRRKVYMGWSYVLLWQSCDFSTMAFEKHLEEIGF